MKKEWNELVQQSENNYVYFTHEWFDCWWHAFGSGHRMFIVAIREDDDLVGISPLMICKTKIRKLPVVQLQFMSNNDSPRCGFIIKREENNILTNIIDVLMKNKALWDILLLGNMEENSINVLELKKILDQKNIKYSIVPKLDCPWISLDNDWDSFFNKLSAKSKKTIRNVMNRVHRLGRIKVNELKTAGETELMDKISENAWKYTKGQSYLNKSERKNFFRNLSSVAQEKGWLSLWVLHIDNKPIAYEYHLTYNSYNIALLAEFDLDYRNYSPGAALDFQIIKNLFENEKVYEYDFGGTLDDYKKKWRPNIRMQNDYYVFKNSFYSRLLYFNEASLIKNLRELKKKVAQFR